MEPNKSSGSCDNLRREISLSIKNLQEELAAITGIVNERDSRYLERHLANKESVAMAFAAAKEAIAVAFVAQKEAAAKTEEAQKQYNISHNDLLRKMDDQAKATITRDEADLRFRTIQEKIDDEKKDIGLLQLAVRESTGKGLGLNAMWGYLVGLIGIVVGITTSVLWAVSVVKQLHP